ncbi:hypothetical protein Efla_003258 [Eimeria flavescens]
MSKSKEFSLLDLRNGFYQIRMAERDIFKTSFSSPVGLFERTVMPMGSISAPASFQRVIGPPFSWYGKLLLSFCPTVFNNCGPVTPPHQQHKFFFWSPPCRSAVANIKYLLASSPVLSIFGGSLPTRTKCDAFSFGIGTVLEQQHPGGCHPTQFPGRTLSKPETNYLVIDKEWLALIYALTKWRHYLQQRFCIRTGHKPLVSLLSKSSTQLQDRRARWVDLCMQFPFNIAHMSGKDNVVADLLSRSPGEAETSVTTASARSCQNPAETHSPALALTASGTHARDALMSDIRRSRAGDPPYI